MNMKKIAIVCFLMIFGIANAQTTPIKVAPKSNNADFDLLDKTFASFIKALIKNDKPSFTLLSLKQVDCIDCVGKPEFNDQGYFVPSDIFYLNIAKNFNKSPVYKAILKRGYTLDVIQLKNFKPAVMPKTYPNDLTLYEVWVPTYLKDELSKGHKGASHAFQFVKINGQFKFYGLTSIP